MPSEYVIMTNFNKMPTDNLFTMLEHSEQMIELWTERQSEILAQLALRGEVECDFGKAEITE